MTSIQFDYSTLSTSMSHGDLGVNLIENNCIVEGTSSEGSSSSSSSCADVSPKIIPADRFNIVYLTFGLVGVTALLPWNFFVTANDFWMYKLRDIHNGSSIDPTKKTDLQALFASYLSLANNVPYVIFLIVSTFINNKISQLLRMIGSLIVMFGFFVCITALVEVNTDKWQMGFFSLTMTLVVLISISSAIFQAAAAGVASSLPNKYMHIMVLGQAVAGVVAAVAQILSLIGHCDSIRSALTYFLCADAILLVTTISYIWIQKTDFFTFFMNRNSDDTTLRIISGTEVKLNISLCTVTKRIWPYAISVLVNFWVTLGVFPGITVLVVSESIGHGSMWSGKLFLPVCCFLLFNISDFCGRVVGGWLTFPPSLRFYMLVLSVARIAFIPLFMLCNLYPRSHLPVIFNSDAYYITFITLLGLTNGYLVTVGMIGGTKFVTPQLQEMAGVILSAFLGAGLMLGSVSSYIFIFML